MNGHVQFKSLIENPVAFREIMKHNCSGMDTTYQEWSGKRKFITEVINNNGTILDIGCAGGFFLRTLQEWSEFDLIPYGIDLNEEYIEAAKKLFPEYQDHFQVLNVRNLEQISEKGIPTNYDFVYVSVFDLNKDDNIKFITEKIMPLVKKRLIIGFYGSNKFLFDTPEWQQERDYIQQGIDNLKKNIEVSGSMFNPTKFNQAVAWADIK